MTDSTGGPRVAIRRVYDAARAHEGTRVLVDRLWPRGLTHAQVGEDLWAKDAAPSAELRAWWGHDPERLDAFADRYRAELAASGAVAELVAKLADTPHVTLLYAARDPRVNHAAVLAPLLEAEMHSETNR